MVQRLSRCLIIYSRKSKGNFYDGKVFGIIWLNISKLNIKRMYFTFSDFIDKICLKPPNKQILDWFH